MLEEMILLYLCQTFSFDEFGDVEIESIENLGTAVVVNTRCRHDHLCETKTINTLDLMVWLFGRTKNVTTVN